ncbi:MAG: hypothetical protein QNJ09_10795 [Paracoccaceae bacterium]|nr:hypothetical protein [Paracoccaceae bacterium]
MNALTPEEEPEVSIPEWLAISLDGAPTFQRRLSLWAEAGRVGLREVISEDRQLNARLQHTTGIGFGFFETDTATSTEEGGFPRVGGYQFGVGLFSAAFDRDMEEGGQQSVPLFGGRYSLPILDFEVQFLPQKGSVDGFPAIHYQDFGKACAITAGHVVGNATPQKEVPLACKDCGEPAVLYRRPLPMIDAVQVCFPCGGPIFPYGPRIADDSLTTCRTARKGETVELHLGGSGLRRGTVMNDVSTYSEFISAAAPIIVMIDEFGCYGDSGSLVSSVFSDTRNRDALSMYLGETNAQDDTGHMRRYGFALDLRQLIVIMGIQGDIYGEFK